MPEYDATALDATAGPGATAVLHGMLSTLTEVLDGLDRRLAAMEGAMEGARLEPLVERVARLEERLDQRLAEVIGGRERTAEALASISHGVGHLAARLDQLAEVDDEPEPEPEPEPQPEPEPEPDRIGPLAEAVARLEARLEAAVADIATRLDALPVPDPAPDLAPVGAALDGLARRIDSLPVPDPAPDLAPVLARLHDVAVSVDTVSFGLAGLTDALRDDGNDADHVEEPDVVGVVTQEAERIRGAVAGLGQALATVQAETAALARRPVEVNVDVDLDGIVALLEEHGAVVREEVARLDTLLRGQVAEVAGRTGSITEVIGRLDGRLHEVVDGVRALQRRGGEPVRLTAVGGSE